MKDESPLTVNILQNHRSQISLTQWCTIYIKILKKVRQSVYSLSPDSVEFRRDFWKITYPYVFLHFSTV